MLISYKNVFLQYIAKLLYAYIKIKEGREHESRVVVRRYI